MKRTIIITDQPATCINPVLAALIVGISVNLRPELYQWTTEPTDPVQGDYYYVHNDDLRAAMTAQLGAAAVHGLHDLLPTGRATSIERVCCTLICKEEPEPAAVSA